MVEVFKTSVHDQLQANLLVEKIHQLIPGSQVTFDLEDCDKILRIVYNQLTLDVDSLIGLLRNYGFSAEVLDDDIAAPNIALQSIATLSSLPTP